MPVSRPTAAALHSISNGQGVIDLLVIDCDSFSQPVRLVNDTRDWTCAGLLYTALPFSVKLPTQAQQESPRAQLRIDNVGRELTALIEAIPTGASLLATLRVVSRDTPDVVDYEFISPLAGIQITPTMVTASMGPDEILRQSAVRVRFDPQTAPALFAG